MAYTLFLLKKMWVAFAFAKATHIFSAKKHIHTKKKKKKKIQKKKKKKNNNKKQKKNVN